MIKYINISIIRKLLRYEWEAIRNRLESTVAARLKEPTFILTQNMEAWGVWHGGPERVMELRESLVLNHPWSSVVEILKHETAHQIVELLYGNSVQPHGPEFHRVCHAIGASPLATGKNAPPDIDIFAEESQDKDGTRAVFDKIRKLLALAQSDNQHEAEVALTKARQLMAKYGISQSSAESPEEEYSIYSPEIPPAWPRCIVGMLGSLLQDYFKVSFLFTRSPNFNNGDFKMALTLCGTKINLRLAGYACDCLVRFLVSSWAERRYLCKIQNIRYSQSDFTAFAYGALQSISSTLKAQENQEPDCYALVPAKELELQNYVAWLFPKLKYLAGRSLKLNSRHLAAGRQAGDNFHLHPGIDNEPPSKPKQLNK